MRLYKDRPATYVSVMFDSVPLTSREDWRKRQGLPTVGCWGSCPVRGWWQNNGTIERRGGEELSLH